MVLDAQSIAVRGCGYTYGLYVQARAEPLSSV